MKTSTINTTDTIAKGATLLNIRDGETGTVIVARHGRGGRLLGYDVRLADGDLELWYTGEFIRLYEAQHNGHKVLVTIPED